ncbi:MAG: tetratricopeptide repeat protein, partial [Candidatus Eisenbacteria bacterium]|nr:tetratricopeptide repeat protein [Candidatus Eisenbacteria bacterium]
DFRERMAAFLRRQESGSASPGAVPVLDPTRALALYRRMLAEDGDYAHLDAVRFNSGMILAEAGEPEARRFFADLVATSPGSPYCQEAWLRMGDMAFDEKRFAEAAPLYAHAAEGGEPTLSAIASYKLGWAHFNQDHFEPAADAFRAVLDLYEQRRADVHVDIETEAEAYFVHALAGAGGAPAFARYFDRVGKRPYERRVLLALGQQFRRYGDPVHAAGTDQLVLDRYPASPEALLAAQRQVATFQRAEHSDQARRAQAELAPRFLPDGAWARAQSSDSLRRAGEQFAHDSYLAIARSHHDRAAAGRDAAEWARARSAYETLLRQWPDDAGAAALRLDAGNASAQSGDAPAALRYFAHVAKHAPDTLAAAALAQAVATTDAWYERTRGARPAGSDSLALAVIESGDALRNRFPAHALAADVTWRQAQLAVAHHWDDRAARDLPAFASRWPADARAPLAALQHGEALFRLGRFEAAGAAFETARTVAVTQKRDSLARRAERALPVCAYRAADAAVAADSNAYSDHARRFEQVAARWPGYEDAALAQYRAALSWQKAGKPREAVRAYGVLLARQPRGEFAREARLQTARSWEAIGDSAEAGAAYLAFSAAESDPDNAAAAWLRAADLYSSAGRVARADSLRLEYVRRHPADVEGAMGIYEALARRDLAAVGPGRPVSALLAAPARGKSAAPARSHLSEYLRRAKAQPALGSRELVAHVRFLLAEEAREACAAVALTQPLARSVAARKTLLDSTLARYRRCADLAVPVWAHASAYRIGETLQEFASALEHSQAPPDLAGDDLLAYRDVLAEKARPFANRGQDVWAELLRQNPAAAPADEWVARAREQLGQKLATRFYFQPEVEFPLLDAQSPNPSRAQRAAATEGASR